MEARMICFRSSPTSGVSRRRRVAENSLVRLQRTAARFSISRRHAFTTSRPTALDRARPCAPLRSRISAIACARDRRLSSPWRVPCRLMRSSNAGSTATCVLQPETDVERVRRGSRSASTSPSRRSRATAVAASASPRSSSHPGPGRTTCRIASATTPRSSSFIETKWNLPALTFRDANADDLLECLDFRRPAFLEPPVLSPPGQVVAPSACTPGDPGGPIPPPDAVTPA